MHQPELGGIRVLVFIHHDVAVLGAAGLQRLRMLVEEPQSQEIRSSKSTALQARRADS